MNTLEQFINLLCGDFDNKEQLKSNCTLPLAAHVNRVCNDKIKHLPEDFKGYFVIEESYYTTNDRTTYLPHLFLFTLNDAGKVQLNSYEIPSDVSKENFKNDNPDLIMDYETLEPSAKFNPMVYEQSGSSFKGKSVSDFGHGLIFTLEEETSPDGLIVKETFMREGKRTFGFDEPLIYKRK